MTRKEKILSAVGFALFGAALVLAFEAYLNPSMLIDFANLRFCS